MNDEVKLNARRPRISADEDTDPIQPKTDVRKVEAKAPQKKEKDIVVQFSTRISHSTRQLIDQVVADQDVTVREVIERAVNEYWRK